MFIKDQLLDMGFTLSEEIGQGGYARVYTVLWDQYPNQTFVAKVISVPERKQKIGEQSFLNEITTLSCLYHRNIIKIYKHFTIDRSMVIIMEYCPKGSLHNYVINNGALDIDYFRIVAKSILHAVAYCHENMIAHRDIKPANILLDCNHHLKLCDFGLSDPTKSRFTCLHNGSLGFAPPEMITNPYYDPKKADIFSMGVTFYFLVVGKLPWASIDATELRKEIVQDEIEFPDYIPSEVKTLILLMTRKNPNTRPTAEALLKHEFFETLPSLLQSPQKIRNSGSNLISSEVFTLATHFRKVNKAYTCRLNIKANMVLIRSSNAL